MTGIRPDVQPRADRVGPELPACPGAITWSVRPGERGGKPVAAQGAPVSTAAPAPPMPPRVRQARPPAPGAPLPPTQGPAPAPRPPRHILETTQVEAVQEARWRRRPTSCPSLRVEHGPRGELPAAFSPSPSSWRPTATRAPSRPSAATPPGASPRPGHQAQHRRARRHRRPAPARAGRARQRRLPRGATTRSGELHDNLVAAASESSAAGRLPPAARQHRLRAGALQHPGQDAFAAQPTAMPPGRPSSTARPTRWPTHAAGRGRLRRQGQHLRPQRRLRHPDGPSGVDRPADHHRHRRPRHLPGRRAAAGGAQAPAGAQPGAAAATVLAAASGGFALPGSTLPPTR